jgi:hypothetical protein
MTEQILELLMSFSLSRQFHSFALNDSSAKEGRVIEPLFPHNWNELRKEQSDSTLNSAAAVNAA